MRLLSLCNDVDRLSLLYSFSLSLILNIENARVFYSMFYYINYFLCQIAPVLKVFRQVFVCVHFHSQWARLFTVEAINQMFTNRTLTPSLYRP